jgi:hypothetical protein
MIMLATMMHDNKENDGDDDDDDDCDHEYDGDDIDDGDDIIFFLVSLPSFLYCCLS